MKARTLIGLTSGFAILLAAVAPLAPAQAPDDIASAEELLTSLETADQDLNTLQAGISYTRRMLLQGDEQTRRGRLYFERDIASGDRIFAIHFDDLYVNQRRDTDEQQWIFDGEWLIERRPNEKQYIARQIAPPGENIDPLRLGEGPLPIPIGQRAADVLARYKAELVNPFTGLENESGAVKEFVADTWQLKLTPHESMRDDDEFREIRLWYDQETLLPRLAKTLNRTGDESFVQLVNLRRNAEIREDPFNIEPPEDDAGWDVQIKEFRGE
jgi:hypothetical protein